ncbi:MAG: hypothetical protein OEV91_03985, partial [Desulfobulbaceae bacterium]|nr:hypothetical protein [Desulfobulbaceae bacterium]
MIMMHLLSFAASANFDGLAGKGRSETPKKRESICGCAVTSWFFVVKLGRQRFLGLQQFCRRSQRYLKYKDA